MVFLRELFLENVPQRVGDDPQQNGAGCKNGFDQMRIIEKIICLPPTCKIPETRHPSCARCAGLFLPPMF